MQHLRLIQNKLLKQLRNAAFYVQMMLGRFKRAEHIMMIISAMIIGILGGFGAIGFRYIIKLSHAFFFRTWEYSMQDEDYLSTLVIASDFVHNRYSFVLPDDNLDLVMHQFGRLQVDELPVVRNARDKVFLGTVRRLDVINRYNKEIFKRDLAGGIHSVITAVQKEREIELADNFRFVELDLPDGFVGRTIKDLDIRGKFDIEIILIKTPEEGGEGFASRPGKIPTAEHVFSPGEKILILGETEKINKFKLGIGKEKE